MRTDTAESEPDGGGWISDTAGNLKEGERLLIPINMRDGSLLCVGRGNED